MIINSLIDSLLSEGFLSVYFNLVYLGHAQRLAGRWVAKDGFVSFAEVDTPPPFALGWDSYLLGLGLSSEVKSPSTPLGRSSLDLEHILKSAPAVERPRSSSRSHRLIYHT